MAMLCRFSEMMKSKKNCENTNEVDKTKGDPEKKAEKRCQDKESEVAYLFPLFILALLSVFFST